MPAARDQPEQDPKPDAEEDAEPQAADVDGAEALVDLGEPAGVEATLEAPPPGGRRAEGGKLARLRDPVELFLAEARRYPRLTEEEERTLGVAVREHGDRDAIVASPTTKNGRWAGPCASGGT